MQPAPIPSDEEERLRVVRKHEILDTPAEERFDLITRAAVEKLRVPISTITVVDSNREWFKSCVGTSAREGSRESSFCGHVLEEEKIFIIEDTKKDPRFADNPQVVGPDGIRFYAGVALHDRKTHQPLGTFCVKDVQPRTLTTEQIGWIMEFARMAEEELNRT